MKMNLPNKLTMLRVLLVPLFIVLFFWIFKYHYWASLLVFIIASITDALDGHLARSKGLTTIFGKFMDPLADKILVAAALICFVEVGLTESIPVIIIIVREFAVSGLRLVTANSGVVVPANIWGKLKTAFTMCAIICVMIFAGFQELNLKFFDEGGAIWYVIQGLIWASAVLTVISGIDYVKTYWKFIDSDK